MRRGWTFGAQSRRPPPCTSPYERLRGRACVLAFVDIAAAFPQRDDVRHRSAESAHASARAAARCTPKRPTLGSCWTRAVAAAALLACGCGRLNYDATARDGGPAPLDAGSRDAGSFDAGNRDAGNRDAGNRDGGLDGGLDASVDAFAPIDAGSARTRICADAIACLDFETPFAAPLTTLVEDGSDPPTRDTLRAFRGSALHLHASSATSTASGLMYPIAGAVFAAGTVYVSAWVRVEREEIPAYLALLELNNAGSSDPFVKVSLDHNVVDQLSLYTPGDYGRRPGDFPTATWVCIELTMRPDPVGTFARASADSRALMATDPLDPGLLRNVFIAAVSELGTHDVWFDDVYIGTREVGCLPE